MSCRPVAPTNGPFGACASPHDIIAHYVGPEVDGSLHIEVGGGMTLYEVHDIETATVEDVRSIPDVFVHVDSRELGEWKEEEEPT